jgi:hypothetical protein
MSERHYTLHDLQSTHFIHLFKIDEPTILGIMIGDKDTKRNKKCSIVFLEYPSTRKDKWMKRVSKESTGLKDKWFFYFILVS